MVTGGDDSNDRVPLRFDEPTVLGQQAFDLFFNPEIARRASAGTLDRDFELVAAQVVFHVSEPTEVRFNDEVDAQLVVVLDRDVEAGERVAISDVRTITGMEMAERDGDRAHITAIYQGSHRAKPWIVLADSRFNLARSRSLATAAREYLLCAESELEFGRMRPFVSSLFYSVEAIAQAKWTLLPELEALRKRSHRSWHSQHHRISKLGIVTKEGPALHRELLELRDRARYDTRFSVEEESARDWMRRAHDEFEELQARLTSTTNVDLAA